jgi:hypothetical protein
MMNGILVLAGCKIARTDTQSPQQRRHPPQSHLTHAKRGNPDEVWRVVDTASKPTARKAELLSGKGWIKKRTLPAERQQEDITGQIGPTTEIPTLKGG